MADYRLLDKLLHRLALSFRPLAELTFDIDQKLVRHDARDIISERHVFISGLARAGTTILMRQFYSSGAFRSLTYRDMPFVLAPNFWKRLASNSRASKPETLRPHADRIMVDADSPESLDEVFWRIFAGEDYIGLGQLRPHSVDHELRWKFICYVNAILNSADERQTRYLSKNNNNILRLATIRECFPNALIVVPFRHPLFHSESLLRQHLNFSKLQTEDSFVGAYMSWLAHHEFGLDHRPFVFDGDLSKFDSGSDPELADYWLNVWCRTYEWLEASAPADTVFVCYETLCSDPEVWEALAGLAEISGANLNHEPFVVSENDSIEVQDQNLVSKALDLYERLRHQAQSDLDV